MIGQHHGRTPASQATHRVTHRGIAHEFTVISGHLPPGHPESLVAYLLKELAVPAERIRQVTEGGAKSETGDR